MKLSIVLLLLLTSTALFGQDSRTLEYKDCEILAPLLKSAMTEFKEFRGEPYAYREKPLFADSAFVLTKSIPFGDDDCHLNFNGYSWVCKLDYSFTNKEEMEARVAQFDKSMANCFPDYISEKGDGKTHYKHKDFPGTTGYAHNLKNPMIWGNYGGSDGRYYFSIDLRAPSILDIGTTNVSVGRTNYETESGFAVSWIEEDSSVTGIYVLEFPEQRQILPNLKKGKKKTKYIYNWDDSEYEIQFNADSMWLTTKHPEYGELMDVAYHTTKLKEKSNQRNFLRGSMYGGGADGFRVSLYKDTIIVDKFELGVFFGKVEDNSHIKMANEHSTYLYYAMINDEVWVKRHRQNWLTATVFTRKKDTIQLKEEPKE